jgi:FkbM family methyltransferase
MTVAEFVYTVVLRPKPLKRLANTLIKWFLPSQLHRHGAIVVLNPNDPVISGALTFGVYEQTETRFFCRACQPDMTFLDIGANVGYYTALAISRIGEHGRIIALEPDRESFEYLKRTVAANRSANVTCIQKAAGNLTGELKLYVSSDNRGDNRLYANDLSDRSYNVAVSTVDSMLEECGVLGVDLVKIDVQGFEGQVLHGMRETIRRSENIVIMTEFWPFGLRSAGTPPEQFLLALKDAGLRLYELTNKGTLVDIEDNQIISRFTGRQYTNIIAARGNSLPAALIASLST